MGFWKYGAKKQIVKTYENLNELIDDLESKGFSSFRRRIASIEPIKLDPDRYLYVRNHSVSGMEWHGPNENGDGFPYYDELQPNHLSFVGSRLSVDHQDDIIIGMVLDSVLMPPHFNENEIFVEGGHVENILAHDKKMVEASKFPNLIEWIENGDVTDSSMGANVVKTVCFPPGTKITMKDGIRKSIENIKIGEEIYSHFGKVRKVSNVFEREYSGILYSIKTEGNPDRLLATPEHPLLVANKYKATRSKFKKECPICGEFFHQLQSHIWQVHPDLNFYHWRGWEEIQDLEVGSKLLYPRISFGKENKKDFACLLGYYLSEGCVSYDWGYKFGNLVSRYEKVKCPFCSESFKLMGLGAHLSAKHPEVDREKLKEKIPYRVEFYFNITEKEYTEEIKDLVKRLYPKAEFTEKECDNSRYIMVYSKELARDLLKYGGTSSHNKKLNIEVFNWDEESLLSLFGSYINGDGHIRGIDKVHSGTVSVVSASEKLIDQFYLIVNSLGIFARKEITKRPDGIGYNLIIPSTAVSLLCKYSSKVRKGYVEKETTLNVLNRLDEKYIYHPIRDILVFPYTGYVYNLEVEEDESYIANDIIVHNCSICGNIAYSEDEYCSHIIPENGFKNSIIKTSSGEDKLCYEVCRGVTFFEDAIIVPLRLGGLAGGEGADTQAKILEKVASQYPLMNYIVDRKKQIKIANEEIKKDDNDLYSSALDYIFTELRKGSSFKNAMESAVEAFHLDSEIFKKEVFSSYKKVYIIPLGKYGRYIEKIGNYNKVIIDNEIFMFSDEEIA